MPDVKRTARRGVFRSVKSFYVRDPERGSKWRRFATYEEACAFKDELEERPKAPQPSRDDADPGWIYFIWPEGGGPIKIGFAAEDPSRRRAQLQIGSPVKLEVLGFRRGRRGDEKVIHKQYEAEWSHGEWYQPTAALMTEAESDAPACEDVIS